MKMLLITIIALTSTSSMACKFQNEKSDLVKSKNIKCNEVSRIATIKNPKVDINGEFYNLGAIYITKEQYWDTDSRRYNSRTRDKVVVERKLKTKKVNNWISARSQNRICQLFGFSRSLEISNKGIYSYFSKAYSFDHDELFDQSIYYAPIKTIKCK